MKKKIIVLLIIVLLATVPVVVYLLTRGGGSDIAEGKYVIVNDTRFPDAYTVVKGKTIQCFNIDLNAYYQDKMMKGYRRVEESRTWEYVPATEDELYRMTDVNSIMVSHALDYSNIRATKVGTRLFNYSFIIGDGPFGMVIRYDSAQKTITMMQDGVNIQFQKQK